MFGLGVGSILTISIMILLLQIVAMCPYLFTYGTFMYTEIMCSRFAALLPVEYFEDAVTTIFLFKIVDFIQNFGIHISTSLTNYT